MPEKQQARAYAYGADRRNQLKTTDLIPKRFVACGFVILLLLSCIAAINFLASGAPGWSSIVGAEGERLLAIRGQGSLTSWFSSFLLIMTGLASLQIYALRQHRCDDYRGTYRLWIWMAGLFILASVNCVVNIGEVVGNIARSLAPESGLNKAWMPVALQLVALTVLVARGVFEVKESRGSLALVVFVWGAYSAALALQLPSVPDQMVGFSSDQVIGNCFLFGTAGLFFAHLTYGRFIFLRAHGLIQLKPKVEKVARAKKKKADAESDATEQQTSSSKRKRVRKTAKSSRKKAVAAEPEEVVGEEEVAAPKPARKVSAKTRVTKAKQKKAAKRKPQADAEPLKGGTSGRSSQELLKELADASRAKQSQGPTDEEMDLEGKDPSKLTKSQRRRLRKQQKLQKQQQRRRAA